MRILYLALLVFVFFSSVQVKFPSSSGFISIFTLLLFFIIFVFTCSTRKVEKRWLIGFIIFFSTTIVNQSSILSSGLILVFLCANLLVKNEPVDSHVDFLERFSFIIIVFFLFTLALNLAGINDFTLWSSTKEELGGFPRLRMFSDEASYFGMIVVAFLFLSASRLKICIYSFLFVISQSYYSILYFVLLIFRRFVNLIIITSLIFSFFLFPFLLAFPELYFSNSGLIRLIGLNLIPSMDFSQWVFGSGIGLGDKALTPLFNSFGVENGSGFLFSFFYDVGALGLFGYFLCVCRNRFDVILLTFLLLNFGAASFNIIFIISISRYLFLKSDKWVFKSPI
ncbi:hypothetical protein QWZ04_03925 [Vibrio tapetis subsp. quintayensis]|uniref:hypothetical protein n=1 Tax=Vibrio tapetis TaxID=52443 RepID=UPI0025B501C9|nr:hypothetical protein [Vibrio tapetis]MDN3679474.1 hypothetical protein [Vibrio tapetis subsp. quintayensis]